MALAYIGLGGNLGDARTSVRNAMDALGRLPHTRLLRTSSLYRTAPVGYLDQPDFINAVAAIDTGLTPLELLGAVRELEHEAGRVRSFKDAPRTLDLDVLLYDDHRLDDAELTLPHPRMHERAFVLAPLVEIAPECVVPGHGTAAQCLARCAEQQIDRLF